MVWIILNFYKFITYTVNTLIQKNNLTSCLYYYKYVPMVFAHVIVRGAIWSYEIRGWFGVTTFAP